MLTASEVAPEKRASAEEKFKKVSHNNRFAQHVTDSVARRSLRGTIRPSKSDCSKHIMILTFQQKRDLSDQVGEEGLKGGAGPGGGGGFGGGFPGGGGGGFSGFNAGDPNDIFK